MLLYEQLWRVNSPSPQAQTCEKYRCKYISSFTLDNIPLEVVFNFIYLGVAFNFNSKFMKRNKNLINSARKAMYSVINKAFHLHLDIESQLDLFNSLVLPILIYCSEVWGYEDINIIETFYLKFLKQILNLHKKTVNYMIYGLLGVLPIRNVIDIRMISFWAKLVTGNTNTLSLLLYRYLYKLHIYDIYDSEWLMYIKNILN